MNKYIFGMLVTLIAAFFSSVVTVQADVSQSGFQMPAFSSVDTNNDGRIDNAELEAFRATRAGMGKQMNRRDSASAFASFDKDQDGFISQQEFGSHSRYLNRLNGTGQ